MRKAAATSSWPPPPAFARCACTCCSPDGRLCALLGSPARGCLGSSLCCSSLVEWAERQRVRGKALDRDGWGRTRCALLWFVQYVFQSPGYSACLCLAVLLCCEALFPTMAEQMHMKRGQREFCLRWLASGKITNSCFRAAQWRLTLKAAQWFSGYSSGHHSWVLYSHAEQLYSLRDWPNLGHLSLTFQPSSAPSPQIGLENPFPLASSHAMLEMFPFPDCIFRTHQAASRLPYLLWLRPSSELQNCSRVSGIPGQEALTLQWSG